MVVSGNDETDKKESEMLMQQYEDQHRAAYDERHYTDRSGNMINISAVEHLSEYLRKARALKKKLFFIGNGGSAGIAVHMTADFLKNGRMRAIDMYGAATITCLGNDYGYEYIFSKQLELLADEGDVLIAISSSGNSPNILLAADVMKKCGGTVVTMTGFREDNQLRQRGDYNLYVPSMEYGIVESIHNRILQQVVDEMMTRDRQEA